MSEPAISNPVTNGASATEPDGGKTRRGRKSSQSGFSLLARGEPQIWFTGGMLVVCLAMISGLMCMILAFGLPTFWPKRLDLIALSDGSIEVGQPQKTGVQPVDEFAAGQSSADEASAGESSAGEAVAKPTGLRHYYRTANFDITGEHYRWIGPDLMNENGIATPAWAMVVERLENGRLYGIPTRLTEPVRPSKTVSEELQQVDSLVELLEAFPQDLAPELAGVVERLRTLATQRLSQGLRDRFIDDPPVATAGQLQVAVNDSWSPLAEQPTDAQLSAARIVWSDSAELEQQLQRLIDDATSLRHDADDLMVEISRLDAEISDLRANIRRAELDTDSIVPRRVEDIHNDLESLVRLRQQQELLQGLSERLRETLSNETEYLASVDSLESTLAEYVGKESANVQNRIADWMQPLEQSPLQVQQAVKRYMDGFRDVAVRKEPMLKELSELQAEMNASVTFAVPTRASTLAVDADALGQLSLGKLTESVREQLSLQGVEVSGDRVEISPLNDLLQLVQVDDAKGGSRLLAIVQAGYAEAASQPSKVALLLPEKELQVHEIVRAIAPNQLSLAGKFSVYLERWREFLLDAPREAGTEGGIFPAIWGTVVMTLIMTVAVVPFGVMAALYLREYTHAGPLVSLIRISINNLAGVPSIVYGVFGFSFFCYTIGAYIDGGAKNADLVVIPSTQWLIAMSMTAMLGTAAFFMSFFGSGPSHTQTVAKRWMSKLALVLWLTCIAALALLILKSPFFDGFYREYLPNPTFGKGGLLWAALTLSLLTLPVVIVATEEALAAVPNSLREGSLACGASKWQTIRRIILPHARPGILTGAILAMARGAGEVAPLMLVGALASAPDLPLDTEFPYFHGSRSFMHLGYQIYTLGFQSQNSEAAKPMVFTCTLLLIFIVAFLNISAIYLRARLRRRFQGSQF